MAVIGTILYFGIVYPIALYCSTDTTILTANGDRKFSFFNVELLLNIYKITLVTMTVLNQTAMLVLTPLFFILYFFAILKRPYYCYDGQSFKRATVSIVAFICVSRAFNAIMQYPEGSVLVEIGGAFGFAALVEWLSLNRLKRILEQEKLTVYQVKILLFMAGNLGDYL